MLPKTLRLAAIYPIAILTALQTVRPVAQTNQPRLLYHSTYGGAHAVAVHFNWLYAGSGTSVRIFDVSNTSAPAEKGHLHLDAVVVNLEVQWPILIIAIRQAGVILANVSDPESPQVIGKIEGIESVADLAVNDTLLFIAASQEGTFIFSIADPRHPKKLAHIPISGEKSESVQVVNLENQLVVAGSRDGWRVFDISVASDPQLVSHTKRGLATVGLAVGDGLLFVGYEQYRQLPRSIIGIYRADSLTSPNLLADVEVNAFVSSMRIVAQSNLLVATSSGFGILLVDVGIPEAPRQLAYRRAAGNDLAFKDDIIYLLDQYSRGIEILQITDTFDLEPVDTIFTGTSVAFIKSCEDRMFVGGFLSELHLPDDGDELVHTSSVLIPASRARPSPSGNLTYVMPEGYFVETSNRGRMSLLGKATKDHIYGVGRRIEAAWVNDTLLVNTVDGEHKGDKGGVELFSVSNPLQPRFLDFYETVTWNNGSIIVRDTLAFVTAYTSFLIMSVASGEKLEPLGRLRLLYVGNVLALYGNYAYVDVGRGSQDTLVTINCANPTIPTIVSRSKLEFKPRQFLIHENYFLAIDHSNEMRVFSLSVPSKPELVQTYSFPEPVMWIDTIGENQIVTAHSNGGLKVWELPFTTDVNENRSKPHSRPTTFVLEPVYPNPGRNVFQVSYRLLMPAEIELAVFNLLGQEIKTFIRDMQMPGSYTITWDGTTNAGLLAPSGVYFVKLSAARQVTVRKLVLSRF